MTEVMLDIETMSTHPHNALVLSIGAVRFVVEGRQGASPFIGARSEWVLDPREQLALGREVSPSTAAWWQQQSGAAKQHWLLGGITALPLALHELAEFVEGASCVWANGICFDIGNLESLYRSIGSSPPWKYNVPRDSRTLVRCFPQLRAQQCGEAVVAHNPVDDCVSQIWQLWEHWPAMVGEAA